MAECLSNLQVWQCQHLKVKFSILFKMVSGTQTRVSPTLHRDASGVRRIGSERGSSEERDRTDRDEEG